MLQFILNNKEIITSLPSGSVLLDFIRYERKLTGTKIGCREGDCGACTVLVGTLAGDKIIYRAMTSCLVPLGNIAHKHIVTVEGINMEVLTKVQEFMNDAGATQCGFCTPGFIMSLTGYCLQSDDFSNEKALASIDGNICRCTGYKSIERAVARIVNTMKHLKNQNRIDFLIEEKILPSYFNTINARLRSLDQKAATNGTYTTGEKKYFTGGGTDLYVQRPEEMKYTDSHFMSFDEEMQTIKVENGICTIGGSATVTALLESAFLKKYFLRNSEFIKLISSTPIRNMATIGGNFVNASPIGDLTIFFLALEATLILTNGVEDRKILLKDFYLGYKKLDKHSDEYIRAVTFIVPDENCFFNFEKVSKRTHLDIASVNTALFLKLEGEKIIEARLSAGGVGPIPMILKKTSASLVGKAIDISLIKKCIMQAMEEISPMGDARGTAAYKTLLLEQLIKAHFITLFPELNFSEMIKSVV